jgi:FtsP/CotA-like multicopper oxidase with cupredoxin domain
LFAATEGRYTREASQEFHPDVEIELTAGIASVPMMPGKHTLVWRYSGKLLKGPESALVDLPDTHLGPILVFEKGRKVRIYFKNDLPEANIVHWHGLHVPQIMDGHPMYGVKAGSGYVYEFTVTNRAGTYMYHAHTHEATGRQVYNGLAGLIIVTDAEDRVLDLPRGEYDQPIVLQDRSFDADNQLRYVQNMRDRHMGMLGDEMIVNGKRHFVLPVATRAYRLRLMNGSNSRIYKLAWEDGTPLNVIATDGGLLEKPVTRAFVMLAPGERVDLWADFSGRKLDTDLTMKSLPFSGAMPGHGVGMAGGARSGMEHGQGGGMMGRHGMMGMMHGGEGGVSGGMHQGMNMMNHAEKNAENDGADEHGGMGMGSSSALPLGGEYAVFKVHVMREELETKKLPSALAKINRLQRADAENAQSPRNIALTMQRMQWLLNGREFEMDGAAPEETIKMDSLQVIEFDNGYSGGRGMGMMSGMAHPMHIHGQQFQIIERRIREDLRSGYDTVSPGYVDDGWKDVVLVMPGEKVTLLKRFDHFKGLFLYHCHNLEHESMGMMRNFKVV